MRPWVWCLPWPLPSFGLGVYVFRQTGSAADMALVSLLAFLPTLLLSVPAGVLADRYDRRGLMMIGDGCSALGILYIFFCMQNGGASLTQICIGVTVSSVFSSLLEPAYRATVSDILEKYVSLKECVPRNQWLSAWTRILSDRGISVRAVDIQEYVTDTYGQTIQEIHKAAWAAVLAAALVMFVVVLLFTRLLVAEDRYDISLRKALGFTGRDIKGLYVLQFLPVLLAGILAGIASGNLLGEQLAGMFLKALGATGFRFLIDYGAVWGWIPAAVVITVFCACLPGLSQVKHIQANECCMGKE